MLPTWKTIKGMNLDSSEDLLEAFENGKFSIDDLASRVLPLITLRLKEDEEVELVQVIATDSLSSDGKYTSESMRQYAQKIGLELLSPEICFLLRLQYPEQPDDEWLLMGMDRLDVVSMGPIILSIGRYGHSAPSSLTQQPLCLRGIFDASLSIPYTDWGSESRWIFARPRN